MAQITVMWDTLPGLDYNLYWTLGDIFNPAERTKIAGVTSPFLHTGLTDGTEYFYAVTAVNSGGESDICIPGGAITMSAPPQNVSAVGGIGQITVDWDPSVGAVSYNLYWSDTTGVTPQNGTKIAGVIPGAVIPDLQSGTEYFVIVTAVNDAGESPASLEASATTEIVFVFATFDPAAKSSRITLSNGNLTETSDGTGNFQLVKATQFKSAGKWYCEFISGGGSGNDFIGIANAAASVDNYLGVDANSYALGWGNPGFRYHIGGQDFYGFWTGIMSMLLNFDTGELSYWAAGVDKGVCFGGIAGSWAVAVSNFGVGHVTVNFGETPFNFTPPPGFTGWRTPI